jgi:hypothetical protein
MEDIQKQIILTALSLLFTLSPFVILVILLLFFPEKIEKWSALLWKILSKIGGIFRFAHKTYVKHDLQGRVNGFVRKLKKTVPLIGDERLRIEWVDPSTPRKSFMDKGQVVLRLRREDPHDQNFIHGAYLFVSETLLRKAKRYISPSQGEAADLFVCSKILEAEKPSLVGFFLDEYLHPSTEKKRSKVSLYIDDFAIVDKGGYFLSVFLHELNHIGNKVFGRTRNDLIISEVDKLVVFLKGVATRTVGDNTDLEFEGKYCSFLIVIVGKPAKLVTIEVYIRYLRRELGKGKPERIYILGREENKEKLETLFQSVSGDYDCVRRLEYESMVKYPDHERPLLQFLMILELKGAPLIKPSR